MSNLSINTAVAALLLAATAARADGLELDVRLSGGYSDNVYRTSSNEESSALYAPGFAIPVAVRENLSLYRDILAYSSPAIAALGQDDAKP